MIHACTRTGAVFRRRSNGASTWSLNGVGTGSISWQGYEVITGRIDSASEGAH